MNRAWMDRFIDTIEWIAAGFVGIVALNIFVGVLLRNTLNYAIPDSFDIGRMLLGILIGTYSSIFIAAPLLGYLGVKRDWSGVEKKGSAVASRA